ncbi:hypothetical protein N566_14255 [Streptomycetaceae bacterium MP113-05]|nr:hypothetical protein N566_14255 [Streptomycetaceae bacterium MP113-05]
MIDTSGERAGNRTPGGFRLRAAVEQLGPRRGAALIALWLLATALAAREVAAVAGVPPGGRLPALFSWLGPGGALQVGAPGYDADDPFAGTPFAGLVLTPLRRSAEVNLGAVWTVGSLLLVVAVAVLAVRALPDRTGRRRTGLLLIPAACSLVLVSTPVRHTLGTGQGSILPVLLVLLGWLTLGAGDRTGADRRAAGVLIGLAAAFQPAVLLFAPLLWLTGRRAAAGAVAGTFAACTAVAWGLMPTDSHAYWLQHVAGASLADSSATPVNQSLHGVLLRMGVHGPLEIVLFAALAAAVSWLALRRAAHYVRDGQPLLAAAVTGCAVVAVSPVTWQHQQLWILLAVAGRVGRRSGDRIMWPVFLVAVMTLDGSALMPHVAGLMQLGDNAVLVTALLVAVAAPFLTRDAPYWNDPVRTGSSSRPGLLLELLLIRIGYWVYSVIRGHAPDTRGTAEGHGLQVLDIERVLYLDWEHALNRFAVAHPWLEAACNVYYQSLHYAVPVSLLVVLYVRRPPEYRRHRTALSFATLLGLVGFWLYPLAPPRLMPGLGFVDTAHGPQDLSDPDFGALTALSNQYAAMPSLHVGWSLWCGIVVLAMTRNRWLRALGLAYPLLTTFVVMTTANHYLLDAFGGALVVAAGYGLQRVLFRLRGSGAAAAGTGGVPVREEGQRHSRDPAVDGGRGRDGRDAHRSEEHHALSGERHTAPARDTGGAMDVHLHQVQQQRREADHRPVQAGSGKPVGVVLQDRGGKRDQGEQDEEGDVQPEQP